MQYRVALAVFFLIFFSIHWPIHSDESLDLVQTLQDHVRTIALAAQGNYARTCENLGTCLSPQNCSRLECFPLPNQNSELTCVNVNNNTVCSKQAGEPCNSHVDANFLRGYVRTPFLNSSVQEREAYLGSSICSQRSLDPTFSSVRDIIRSNSSLNYFFNLFFGAVDGSFRYYPGREVLNPGCGTYDPRIRPWYIGATSILKDVVVLIDTGSAMQENANFLDPTSFLETTTSMMGLFARTLTPGDRITVLPVNGSGSHSEQPNYQYVVPNGGVNVTAPDYLGLNSYVSGSAFAGVEQNGDGTPTNFTDGFVKAKSILISSSPTNSMKIVILITNSQSNNTPDNGDRSVADELKKFGLQLFVYDLHDADSPSWGNYSCQDGGNEDVLSLNPLLFLSSYFSFLARARMAANGDQATPFWQTPYVGASGLGMVVSVAYPAMSPDGQLIGVAGIDLQLSGLDSDPLLESGVERLLFDSPYSLISENENAGNIPICRTEYKHNCPGITGSTKSLCTAEPASDEQLKALLCCKDCNSNRNSRKKVVMRVAVGVSCGLLVLLSVLFVLFLVLRSKRKQSPWQSERPALNNYSYDELFRATNGFDKENIIGEGSFGEVFKAVLGHETLAVKRLFEPAHRPKDFEAEINILGLTSHSNLVELKGTCFQPSTCFLVYEFVANGDLHHWLWPQQNSGRTRFLNWNKRRQIARGVARGLNYLHRGLQPNRTVFHLDIKPQNILLEYNFNPKIADFGISQLYKPGYTFKIEPVARGTFGYIAPEVIHGQVNPDAKLDVYSYGMVLLQLMCGRKMDDPDVKPFLLQWARTRVEDGFVERVVDESLVRTVREEHKDLVMANCKQLIILALRCLSDRPELRPEMSEVFTTIDTGFRDIPDLEPEPASEDDRPGSPELEKHTRAKSIASPRKYFLGERHRTFKRLNSDREENPEIALSATWSPAKKGRDSFESDTRASGSQDGLVALGRSSTGGLLAKPEICTMPSKLPKTT